MRAASVDAGSFKRLALLELLGQTSGTNTVQQRVLIPETKKKPLGQILSLTEGL